MASETQIQEIENWVTALLTDDIFLVSVRVKPTNNIKIFLDADSGLSIDKCIRINRALYKIMEEKPEYADGNFSLEVSSPGIDEPLKLLRQYQKNIGRNVEVVLLTGQKVEGTLTSVVDNTITIHSAEGKGKKAVEKNTEIDYAEIKQTTVLIKF
jgi:ribosome maturation factor RimP